MPYDDEVMEVGGSDRPPAELSPRTKRVAGGVAALAVLAYGGWRVADRRAVPQPVAVPTAPAPSLSARPVPQPTVAPSPLLGAATGARLVFAGGGRLTDVGLDDNSRHTVGLAGEIRELVPVDGGHVALLEVAGSARPRFAWYVARSGNESGFLGYARSVVPAARTDRVWLVDADAPERLSRVGMNGQTDVVMRLGADRRPVREVARGMLTVVDKYFSRSLELFEWRRKEILDTYFVGADLVVADSNSEHVAYTLPSCARSSCRLRIAALDGDPEDGAVDVATPDGWTTEIAEFSPDGTQVAMLGRIRARDTTSRPAMLIADVRTGGSVTVRGLARSPERYTRLAWTPNGEWLFATAARPGAPMLSYRAGASGVRLTQDPRGADATGAVTALAAY